MTHVTRRLTAKNRDQLRDPTFGNRVWATFTFLDYTYPIDLQLQRWPPGLLLSALRAGGVDR